MELAYWDTEYRNTSAISDLGLFIVSRRFLAALGLLSRYCACVTIGLPTPGW